MRFLAMLCFGILASCAPQTLGDSPYSNRVDESDTGMLAVPALRFVAANFPPQCDPTPWFPEGKVPDDFLNRYDTREYQRFDACVRADSKARATGREVLFYMPESMLKTECAVADQYPDGKVKPSFFGYPRPPEYDRYIECVIAEARRDGERVRLASVKSFPPVGACYSGRITEVGPGWGFVIDGQAFEAEMPRHPRGRAGDSLRMCVVELPRDCPAHDLRGIKYRGRNLRTGEVWNMWDSNHLCRGA